MSSKSQAGHVDIYNDPLPLPLTTRNLRPRSSKFLTCVAYRNASEVQGTPHTDQGRLNLHTNPAAMQSSAGPSSGSSRENQDGGSSKPATTRRKRARVAKGKRKMPTMHSSNEEVDELIDDDDDDIPLSLSVHAQTSASTSGAGPSNTNVLVSSLSLRKILHPSNIDIIQKSSPSPDPEPEPEPVASTSSNNPQPPAAEPLSEYTCPICFFPPTNATLTPCGHVCCGSCLFNAVRSTMQRAAVVAEYANTARCPVCRAEISGWDGKGGGVIGLKPRVSLSVV